MKYIKQYLLIKKCTEFDAGGGGALFNSNSGLMQFTACSVIFFSSNIISCDDAQQQHGLDWQRQRFGDFRS